MPIKPRLPKDSLLELRDGGRDALRSSDHVQTMFRLDLGSDSEFRCALATSYTNVFAQRLYRCEKHDALPINSRAKRLILFILLPESLWPPALRPPLADAPPCA